MTETLEKAHKGDPGYEKWLAKYRAFRTAKAAKNDDAAKSEIEKEADAKRRTDLVGSAGGKKTPEVSKNAEDLEAQEAARREADEDAREAENKEQAEKNAADQNEAEKRAAKKPGDSRPDETARELKRQKAGISADKRAEIAKRFMDKLNAKKAGKKDE